MSVPCLIAMPVGIEGFRAVYCHTGGHPSLAGVTLNTYYRDRESLSALIELGALAKLGRKVESPWTEAYVRDLGEEPSADNKTMSAYSLRSLAEKADMWTAPYLYLFVDPHWIVISDSFGAATVDARLSEATP